ncbi:MAG: hypothetical protein AB1633_11605, partial [Elusimicrobiota bacterium]
MTGSTALLLSSMVILFLFESKEIGFLCLCSIILGDASAALIGKNFGRIKIGRKSLEGSLACFLMCLTIYFSFKPLLPSVSVQKGFLSAALTT